MHGSRRYHRELERFAQETDFTGEQDKLKLLKEKVFGPIIWRRLASGIRIQDLQANLFEETMDLIMNDFFIEDVIFKNTRFLEDPVSIECYKEKIYSAMRDRSSLVAIDEQTNKVIGCLILKTVCKSDYGRVFSRIQIGTGKIYQSIMRFINEVNRKADVFETFQCETYLRYYLICINQDYRRRKLGYNLMYTGLDIARHLKIDVVMGIFDCFMLQKIAQKLGMQLLSEYEYRGWKDDELVFCNAGGGNYSCAVMAGLVPPKEVPEPVPIKEESNKAIVTVDKGKKGKKK